MFPRQTQITCPVTRDLKSPGTKILSSQSERRETRVLHSRLTTARIKWVTTSPTARTPSRLLREERRLSPSETYDCSKPLSFDRGTRQRILHGGAQREGEGGRQGSNEARSLPVDTEDSTVGAGPTPTCRQGLGPGLKRTQEYRLETSPGGDTCTSRCLNGSHYLDGTATGTGVETSAVGRQRELETS